MESSTVSTFKPLSKDSIITKQNNYVFINISRFGFAFKWRISILRINFSMKLHIVNWNSDKYTSFDEAKTQPDGLAVIAIWFTISQDNNTLLDDVINAVQDLILQG